MSENPIFRDLAVNMKRAGESMVRAHTRMVEANGEMVIAMHAYGESLDLLITAHEEHEDLRETVRRLETLVLQLVDDRKRDDPS